jgi:hypothetical protein
MNARKLLKVARILLIVFVVATAFGFIVMLLWNGLIPALFGGPVLSFWQAVGLLVLSRILFFGGPGGRFRRGGHGPWRRHFRERWEHMSPEERERIRNRMRSRWGDHCAWEDDEKDAKLSDTDISD